MNDLDTNPSDDFVESFINEVKEYQLFESGMAYAIQKEVTHIVCERLRTRLDQQPETVKWASIGAELGLPPDTPARCIRTQLEERVVREIIQNTDFNRLMIIGRQPKLTPWRQNY